MYGDDVAIVSNGVDESEQFARCFQLTGAHRFSSESVTKLAEAPYPIRLVFVLPSAQGDTDTMAALRRSPHILALVESF